MPACEINSNLHSSWRMSFWQYLFCNTKTRLHFQEILRKFHVLAHWQAKFSKFSHCHLWPIFSQWNELPISLEQTFRFFFKAPQQKKIQKVKKDLFEWLSMLSLIFELLSYCLNTLCYMFKIIKQNSTFKIADEKGCIQYTLSTNPSEVWI